jgi:hypothetical protein
MHRPAEPTRGTSHSRGTARSLIGPNRARYYEGPGPGPSCFLRRDRPAKLLPNFRRQRCEWREFRREDTRAGDRPS